MTTRIDWALLHKRRALEEHERHEEIPKGDPCEGCDHPRGQHRTPGYECHEAVGVDADGRPRCCPCRVFWPTYPLTRCGGLEGPRHRILRPCSRCGATSGPGPLCGDCIEDDESGAPPMNQDGVRACHRCTHVHPPGVLCQEPGPGGGVGCFCEAGR